MITMEMCWLEEKAVNNMSSASPDGRCRFVSECRIIHGMDLNMLNWAELMSLILISKGTIKGVNHFNWILCGLS